MEIGTYERLQNTWKMHSAHIRALILGCIKTDLSRRIEASIRVVEIEPVEPPEVEDEVAYEQRLRRSLEHSCVKLNITRTRGKEARGRRATDELRDSSVEMQGPLEPDLEITDGNGCDADGGRGEDKTGDTVSSTGDEL